MCTGQNISSSAAARKIRSLCVLEVFSRVAEDKEKRSNLSQGKQLEKKQIKGGLRATKQAYVA